MTEPEPVNYEELLGDLIGTTDDEREFVQGATRAAGKIWSENDVAERTSETDVQDGDAEPPDETEIRRGGAEVGVADDDEADGVERYVDVATSELRKLSMSWRDVQITRKALAQRGMKEDVVEAFKKIEDGLSRDLSRALRNHPIWPWLSQYPGLGGAYTAMLIGLIGDPRRFPGQPCTQGHILPTPPPARVGDQCRMTVREEDGTRTRCTGTMLPPRDTTGVGSLRHYCGVHVVNGRSPRKTKGVRATWNPTARTALMQPEGIADHIVYQRVPKYREIYDREKERLTRERGAETTDETDERTGAEPQSENGEAGVRRLRPFQVDRIARTIAVKAFLGDLLIAWKETVR